MPFLALCLDPVQQLSDLACTPRPVAENIRCTSCSPLGCIEGDLPWLLHHSCAQHPFHSTLQRVPGLWEGVMNHWIRFAEDLHVAATCISSGSRLGVLPLSSMRLPAKSSFRLQNLRLPAPGVHGISTCTGESIRIPEDDLGPRYIRLASRAPGKIRPWSKLHKLDMRRAPSMHSSIRIIQGSTRPSGLAEKGP